VISYWLLFGARAHSWCGLGYCDCCINTLLIWHDLHCCRPCIEPTTFWLKWIMCKLDLSINSSVLLVSCKVGEALCITLSGSIKYVSDGVLITSSLDSTGDGSDNENAAGAAVLTLWHQLLPYAGWASSARMSKLTNDCSTRFGTECFIAIPIWQHWTLKGYINGNITE